MPKKSSGSVKIFYPAFSRKEVILTLERRLGELQKQLPCLLVSLFGSYSRGNFTAASDIDLLVVYQGGNNNRAYSIVKKTLNIPQLEPHVYPETEYPAMKDVIQKMLSSGVTIYRRKGWSGEQSSAGAYLQVRPH